MLLAAVAENRAVVARLLVLYPTQLTHLRQPRSCQTPALLSAAGPSYLAGQSIQNEEPSAALTVISVWNTWITGPRAISLEAENEAMRAALHIKEGSLIRSCDGWAPFSDGKAWTYRSTSTPPGSRAWCYLAGDLQKGALFCPSRRRQLVEIVFRCRPRSSGCRPRSSEEEHHPL